MATNFSISSLFGGGTPAQTPATPAAAPAQPGNMPAQPNVTGQSSTGTAVNGVVPDQNATPDANASPLDQFKDLWEPVKNEGGELETPTALDPAKVAEAMQKADFSNLITQENLAAITQGGEGAAKAFMDSLNAVTRQSMAQSTLIADKMLEQAIAKMEAKYAASLPDTIKKHTLSESLANSNPVYKDPAVKPVIEAVQAQLAAKFPKASASELTTMATNFVKTMGAALAPQETKTDASKGDNTDWEAFLTAEN